MIEIRNKERLVSNGETPLNRKARTLALKSLEAALNAADPRGIIKSKLTLKGSLLQVADHSFNLDKFSHVYVMGGGKASGSMAEALEEILGDRITKGLVNVPKGNKQKTRTILLHEASHPIPDETGVEGTRRKIGRASCRERV